VSESALVERRWVQDVDTSEVSSSANGVYLFSLVGIALSAVLLLSASDETIASVTAALALM
jgi:hypothetical protein